MASLKGLAKTKLARKRERGVAGPTRLELATSGVTGRRSNQLNYDPAKGADAHLAPCVTREVAITIVRRPLRGCGGQPSRNT